MQIDSAMKDNYVKKSEIKLAPEKQYSCLIYAQNEADLESFKHYEQFVDCGKLEDINNHWVFSRITLDCNN